MMKSWCEDWNFRIACQRNGVTYEPRKGKKGSNRMYNNMENNMVMIIITIFFFLSFRLSSGDFLT